MTDLTAGKKTILGVVLAGGQSRRMGGTDKALVPLAGRPLIAHVAGRLAPQVDAVAINANGDPARFEETALPVFADTVAGHAGPLAGVLAAMDHAARHHPSVTHVATAATDTPFFPEDLVARLSAAATTANTIAMATSDGHRHPVFALWPVALADDLGDWLETSDTLKVMAFVQRHHLAEVDFPVGRDGTDPFFNINTPDDLARAETFMRQGAA
ncbi:molybdenum cofactor guanylyltransferase MobA [Roseitalea porphyridii]|uniref:Molybdenum cofactor guanylyltransferase n=1 Tax=Roseitalea porphyridii TaxID=1852022 RepID=A0A4P6V3K5_9HYPH|nr:molybdenum cofactor guanylyltransferase MobA [Roseitalea porphyridii]QBK31060.1 molybdenum cofactor guanylyltransferase MobA [Roseitalea porphyridii]